MRFVAIARWICVLAAALIAASGCETTPDYSAPASFAISDDAVANVVQQALDGTGFAAHADGTPTVHCPAVSQCTIAYTVHEPFALDYDAELLLPTRQIWKAMFTDPRFQAGTITVRTRAPYDKRRGTAAVEVYFTLSCDRAAASTIDWNEIGANDLKKRCFYTQQSELPFTGLRGPSGVAVDPAGNLFVTDSGNNRVLKLPVRTTGMGSNLTEPTPVELPFNANGPSGVAATAGDVFVAASGRVFTQTAWRDTPFELPFTGPNGPMGLAVGSDQVVYLASGGDRPLLKLQPGSTPQIISFRGGPQKLSGAVAVDDARRVYFAGTDSVWVLRAGDDSPTRLPLPDLQSPNGLAVDDRCNIVLSDGLDGKHSRVLFLPSESTTPVELPFTGLNRPTGVAIDPIGNVYVADTGNNRVLTLSAAAISNTATSIRDQSPTTSTRCS